MKNRERSDIEKAEALLRPLFSDQFCLSYDAAFPRPDGSTASWFQVVFAVGPGDVVALRQQVHALFPTLLATLSQVGMAADANLISLRARRHIPESDPQRPFMFIEAEWSGPMFRKMKSTGDFLSWASECVTYRNHFDASDILTRKYAGQPIN